ncbi:hypothetical protein EV193_110117 [Herbihabitans rhizosphaerae]|uniref:Uncharacterized protein n=1 Tax=Herbihabitans rhizosphaerae TaxID=1872711 RepID=A0A4V2ERT3_9PSEU|nr:hypothetical protein [Herbihabitans rhizosphaerae]RZS33967.1 hypothetical protein EV193_110117 [Herbihabitans rhizosphaerae]
MLEHDQNLLVRFTKLANEVSTLDTRAARDLARELSQALGWTNASEQACRMRRLALCMLDLALEFQDRAADLDRVIIDMPVGCPRGAIDRDRRA